MGPRTLDAITFFRPTLSAKTPMGMAVRRTTENCQLTSLFQGPTQVPSKLTRYSVKEGLPAPETRQLILDIRVLAKLVRYSVIWEVAQPTSTAVAGVVGSADILLKENDLGHDPYLVISLREEVEPDTGQPDPEGLVAGAGAALAIVPSIPSRAGPALSFFAAGTPSLVFSLGSAVRIGECSPVHAET